ncbi:3-oxoacyl-[acyl-carrier-protein] synthase III C-terminal domain-containing protein [Microbulbifer sp. CNSA002]|uniref:3-oxoacyl-[acyl-carrier-protein] synthase III C-terminal domain-containing protein n=1 Tax=Microbulbifer sp. CNSA002 TaxID=3373604 RepID=UPI0039B6C2DD
MMGVVIKGIGISDPARLVHSTEIDNYLGLKTGTVEAGTGIKFRRYAESESAGQLAVAAVSKALEDADMGIEEINCIISASGTMEQAIPYNGANIHRLLNTNIPIPTFDVNMTCLSSVAAINVANALIQNLTYKNILIVSSDIASVGLDWNDLEVGGMFGDGAGAIILAQSDSLSQKLIASHFETHSNGYDYCQIRGGGSLNHPVKVGSGDYAAYGMFDMRGKDAYRLTAKVMPLFLEKLLFKANLELNEIDWVVPHQASHLALKHLRKKLAIPEEKMIDILSEKGNQIAASIPNALHTLLKERAVRKGDKVLVIGSSAGISLGGVILEL